MRTPNSPCSKCSRAEASTIGIAALPAPCVSPAPAGTRARCAPALAAGFRTRSHEIARCRAPLALRLAALSLFPPAASAHSFGRIYNLPVPFWLYAYGAAAALLLSFLIAAWFATAAPPAPSAAHGAPSLDGLRATLRRLRLPALLRGVSLLGLLLCIATGLFGVRDPYRNLDMTLFWVVFVLGFAYLSALIGDLYALVNPWRVLADLLGRVWRGYTQGRLRYPRRLAYWPALALYMLFIWAELFGNTRPFSLAVWLGAYTLLNLAAVGVFGAADWFRHGEFFAVFLRLIARMAPLDYAPGRHLRLRRPFAGLSQERASSWSELVFVLFMLSSTAFDGLRATKVWYSLVWADATGLLTPWLGQRPIYLYPRLRAWYLLYESVCMVLSPFVYLAVYLLFVGIARRLGGRRHSLRELALSFTYSLLPIALVYHVTHYYTLLLTQGVKIVSLLSDPFGYGWNLFGTAGLLRAPFLPDLGTVWHTQVALILFGHIVSVWVAHAEALRLFPSRGRALLSQLPMLVLMVSFTTAGLWILAQPIQGR
ncbi:hypothetical protein [Solimonas soli]|uniref:hypothetical protein n=1 Tax=Solimonas soli TaxID=413479 RepID=UPI0004800024|nr:hypothetical protein [Solimonas soli]